MIEDAIKTKTLLVKSLEGEKRKSKRISKRGLKLVRILKLRLALASSRRHDSQVVKSGELQRVPTGIYTTLV